MKINYNFSAFKVLNLHEMLISALICTVAFNLIRYFWSRRHLYRLSYQCEGDVSWPLIGNLLEFDTTGEAFYKKLLLYAEKYDSPIRLWLGPFLFLIIHDPDDIQIVLKSQNALSKPFFFRYNIDMGTKGLFTSNPPIWSKHRKVIVPTFNRATIKNAVEVSKKQSDIFVQQLEKYSNDGKYFDVFHSVSRLSLDIILETIFGLNIYAQTSTEGSNEDKYMKSITRAFEILYERTVQIWYIRDEIFRFSTLHKELKKCIELIHHLSDKIIAEKRALYEDNKTTINDSEVNFQEKFRTNLTDLLFGQLRNSDWSDDEIKDEIITMIMAGADTITHTLSNLILLIAMHPKIQDNVYEEIKRIEQLVESSDGLTLQILNKMEYMEQVIMESMRVFPIAPVMYRITTGDITLKSKNLVIPEGVIITVGVLMMHRSKKYWGQNADKFDPENFSPENKRRRHPHTYIPFSDGLRNCLGSKFAINSLKVILYKLLKSYELVTDEKYEDINYRIKVMLEKIDGCKIKIRQRSSQEDKM